MDIESLQADAYADAKAALRACADAAEQVYAAVARLEEAQRALRRANRALAEVNRLHGGRCPGHPFPSRERQHRVKCCGRARLSLP
jgi:hypothetical protein